MWKGPVLNTCVINMSLTIVAVGRGVSTYQALRVCSTTMGQEGLVRWPPVSTTLPVFPIYQPALQCHDNIDIQGRSQKSTAAKRSDAKCIRASGGPVSPVSLSMTRGDKWVTCVAGVLHPQCELLTTKLTTRPCKHKQLFSGWEKRDNYSYTKPVHACLWELNDDCRCALATHQVKLFWQVGTTQKLLNNMWLLFAHGIRQHSCVVAFLHPAAFVLRLACKHRRVKSTEPGYEDVALSCTRADAPHPALFLIGSHR